MSKMQVGQLGQKKIRKEDLIYMAGLLDGEGCIQLNYSHRLRDKHRNYPPSYQLRVTIVNTFLPVLNWIHKIWDGSLVSRIAKDKGKNNYKYKTQFVWSLTGIRARLFLKGVSPFLRIKKEEARCGIEFDEGRVFHKRHKKVELTELIRREKYRKELSRLKTISFEKEDLSNKK